MSLYKKISVKPRLFLQVTGMELSVFESLLPSIEASYLGIEHARKSQTIVGNKTRLRAIGGGRAYNNNLADRLLMFLLYHRLYLTQEFMTILFKAEHKSVISRSIASVSQALSSVLPTPARIKSAVLQLADQQGAKPKRIGNLADFVKEYPELTILIDGKEQPIPRPKDKQRRKSAYSGKKKQHTVKQLISTTSKGLIVDLSPSFDGSVHDFTYFKGYHDTLCQGWSEYNTTAYMDSGFQGQQDLDLPIRVRQSQKAFRNKPLTQAQKDLNKVRGRVRVKCEHAIGRMKKYRIASDIYRNPKEKYDQSMNIVAGLTNLRTLEKMQKTAGAKLQF